MFRFLIAFGALGAIFCATLPAAAQYYGGPPGYYYDGPPRHHRHRYYRPRYEQPRGNPYNQPQRPRYDPRNGGTYCVLPGYTVQDGICKPYRGR